MMKTGKERRRWERQQISEPEIAMVYGQGRTWRKNLPSYEDITYFFVAVINASKGGFLIETEYSFEQGEEIFFLLRDSRKQKWSKYSAGISWVGKGSSGGGQLAGLELKKNRKPGRQSAIKEEALASLVADMDFLMQTGMFECLPANAVWLLLNRLQKVEILSGINIISQGEKGDCLYLVQSGTCQILVLKDDQPHRVAQLGPGEIVGEMAVLTGELRCADVTALSDMQIWRLPKKQMDAIAAKCEDVRLFLTELVTDRLENSPIIADRTVGKYLVKMKIDHGGWGIVYQGFHTQLKMPVAIKMLKHQMAMDTMFKNQFMKEATIIAKLNHRNIVQVHDIEEQYQTIFIIMEYLEGGTVEALLDRLGTLDVTTTLDILKQACAGLEYAHRKGIVHHDVKPANIFVQNDGQVKMLDFGLAFSSGTDHATLKGTIHYAAPEQIRNDEIDFRVDIYTLGLTAYEMLTGRRPHQDDDIGNFINKRLREEIPDPKEERPDIPEALRNFILRACRNNPDERYQTMGEAMKELESLYKKMVPGEGRERESERRMSSLHLFYFEESQTEVNSLLEGMASRANAMGIRYKVSEFKDV
ncbi:MAG: protein kinase [Proteobacteria bacterium]|nr:protein kinase [Pseudomonadota bacterium]MBU1709439.1 protein kinase [Pseudomonadota bacterium]